MEHVNQNNMNNNNQDLQNQMKNSKTIIVSNNTNKKYVDENYFILQKFINLLMHDGKKTLASKLFYEALTLLKNRLNSANNTSQINVLEVFFQALENVTPSFEVRKVRRAGSTFLVPAMISESRGKAQGIRWIIEAAKSRRGSNSASYKFAQCLADEIYQASLNQGKARDKKKELHNVAIANRAYVRYRWW